MSRINIGSLLSASISLARRAGVIIQAIHKSGDLQTVEKGLARSQGFDDPMTQADLRSQRLIVSGLYAAFPGLRVVGEEDLPDNELEKDVALPDLNILDMESVPKDLTSVPLEEVCVYVDPLDGTKEFAAGSTWCVTTLIGITWRGIPVAGVMHQPFADHSIYGLQGYGIIGVEHKKRKPEHEGQFVAVTSLSHFSDALKEAMELVKPDVILRDGGCGWKCYLLLQGLVDAYIYPQKGTKKWDTCAPEAILREAGFQVSDVTGKPIEYPRSGDMMNTSLIIVRTAKDHERVIKSLEPMTRKKQ